MPSAMIVRAVCIVTHIADVGPVLDRVRGQLVSALSDSVPQ